MTNPNQETRARHRFPLLETSADRIAAACNLLSPANEIRWIGRFPNKKPGLFFTPNALVTPPPVTLTWETRFIAPVRCVTHWFEIDPPEGIVPTTDAERTYELRRQSAFIHALLDAFSLPAPTLWLWSGNKSMHVFWRLVGESTHAEWHRRQRALVALFRADPVSLIPSALARAPDEGVTQIVAASPIAVYSSTFDDILAFDTRDNVLAAAATCGWSRKGEIA